MTKKLNKDYLIELDVATSGQWYWRLKSRNGRTLAHSETYKRRISAVKVMKKLAKALNCGAYIWRSAKGGRR